MDDVFYLATKEIDLKDIKKFADQVNVKNTFIPKISGVLEIEYCDGVSASWFQMRLEEFKEPMDVKFLEDNKISMIFCITHHYKDLEKILPHIEILLKEYGGWIGNDSEGFKPYFYSENIENLLLQNKKANTIANYLYISVISGYYSKLDWQKWADEKILENDMVHEWIYKISLAKDVDEFREAINDAVYEECYYSYNDYSREDAIVGYYYILYIEKKLSLYDLIGRLSDEDDITEASSIHEKENFYIMFKNISEDSKLLEDNEFLERIKLIVAPYGKIAVEQKMNLDFGGDNYGYR